MEPIDLLLKLAAAAFTLVFAGAVMAGDRRRADHRALATFLGLVSLNQLAEVGRGLAADRALQDLFYHVAIASSALDPVALYVFASRSPEPNGLGRRWALWTVCGVGYALALVGVLRSRTIGPSRLNPFDAGLDLATAAFTAAIYALVLAHALRPMLSGAPPKHERLLAPALAIAAIPRIWDLGYAPVRLAIDLALIPPPESVPDQLWRELASPALAIAVCVGALIWVGRRREAHPAARGIVIASLAIGLAFALVNDVAAVQTRLSGGATPAGLLAGKVSAALRWIAFSILVSAAVVRYDMLAPNEAARRIAARGIIAVAFGVLAALVLEATDALAGARIIDRIELALVAVAILASQLFRRAIDRTAAALYGVAPGTVFAESAAALPLRPGARLADRYQVGEIIGRGAQGRTFFAKDLVLDRQVVLKEIPRASEATERLVREARTASAAQHPNIITIYDVILRDADAIIVMERCAGSLAARIARGPPAPDDALAMMDGVLAALDAAHRAGVVHRDIKPGNVLLTAEGTPKLADFGIAQTARDDTVRLGRLYVEGSPGFMAPEQARGEPATVRTDVFGAGRLLSAMLPAPPPSIAAIIARATAADPAARFASAAEFRAALQEARASIAQAR